MTAPRLAPSAGPEAVCPGDALHRLAALVAALMTATAAAGLLAPGVYRDNALVVAGWQGTDLVTLVVAAPLLALARRRSARGSGRARLVLLGMLLYALYNYLFYLFGAAFNALFLAYAALVTGSAAGLLAGLGSLEVERLTRGFRPGAPARPVAAWILAVGAALGGFWTALSVAFLLTGRPPPMVEATAHPTNVTGALDLCLVVALAGVAGVALWRRRPWGWALAVVWCVKGAVYMLALSSATLAAYRAGAAADPAQLALWLPIGAGCALALAALLRGYGDPAAARTVRPPPPAPPANPAPWRGRRRPRWGGP